MALTPAQVLERLKQAAREAGGFILSIHALSRAGSRSVSRRDIVSAFLTSSQATQQGNGRWQILGFDEDGARLCVIVVVDTRIEVITVY